ncbi:three component ABC system middle component [Rugamonas aquatica]|uniref:three component ABC system middle component n=1 Tax=Rugamonas aquatica TaxID=2743357 RepID=UPI0038B43839
MNVRAQYPNEISTVQNPTLGAYALWRFGLAFEARENNEPRIPLAFLVLPLVLHEATRKVILSTHKASGFALFAGKLGEQREEILTIHNRVRQLRELTLESIALGEQAGLLTLNVELASIRSRQLGADKAPQELPIGLSWVNPACERVGHWFGSLTDEHIARTLCVEF